METIPREDLKKECTVCGEMKPLHEYPPRAPSALADIHSEENLADPSFLYETRCKECRNEYHRQWRAKAGDKYRNKQKARHHERRAKMTPEELEKAKAHDSKKTRATYARMKEKVYQAYGGYKCACCGETEPSFLSVDHIANDGALYRKFIHGHGGDRYFRWLVNNNFPVGYQILCWNCQWGKQKNNGICPHKITRNDYLERE